MRKICVCLVLFTVFLLGCSEVDSTNSVDSIRPVQFNITVDAKDSSHISTKERAVDIGTLVTGGRVKLSRIGTQLVKYIDLVITNGSAKAVVQDLLVGRWDVAVQLHDKNYTVIYSANQSVSVFNGVDTQVIEMTLVKHTGSVYFDITLPVEQTENELILWNKLDDLAALSNSEFGPSLVIDPTKAVFTNGIFGGAIFSDASNKSYVQIPSNTIPLGCFSIEFKVKLFAHQLMVNSVISFSRIGLFIHHRFEVQAYTCIEVKDKDGNKLRVKFNHIDVPGFLSINSWEHIAVSVNRDKPLAERITFYRNGVEIPVTVLEENNSENLSLVPCNDAVDLLVGNLDNVSPGGYGYGFNGVMDNLKIYNYDKSNFDIFNE